MRDAGRRGATSSTRRVRSRWWLGLLLWSIPATAAAAPPEVTSLRDCGRASGVELSIPPQLKLGGVLGEKRSVQAPYTVRNCTEQPVVITEVSAVLQEPLDQPQGRRQALQHFAHDPLAVTLPGKSAWSGTLELRSPGRFELRLSVQYARYTVLGSPSRTFVVIDQVRRDAIAACRACRGDWGPHYRSGDESCLCRTSDGGKPCRGGEQCSAGCAFRRFETLRHEKVCDDKGACQSQPVGRAVGVCYEFTSQVSCVTWIPAQAGKQPPQRIPFDLPQACVD